MVFAAAIAGLGASIGAIALVPAMEQAADTIRAPFSVEALRDTELRYYAIVLLTATAPCRPAS
ncbi:MAG: hypothetical protein ACE5EL_05450 [Anaerolineae bacterium]